MKRGREGVSKCGRKRVMLPKCAHLLPTIAKSLLLTYSDSTLTNVGGKTPLCMFGLVVGIQHLPRLTFVVPSCSMLRKY